MAEMTFYIDENGIMVFTVNTETEKYAVVKWLNANMDTPDWGNFAEIKYKEDLSCQ